MRVLSGASLPTARRRHEHSSSMAPTLLRHNRAAREPVVKNAPATEPLYVERVVWFPAYPLAAVLIVIGAVQLFDRWAIGAVLLATALVVAWFSVARYTVSNRGVEVVVGGGRPRLSIPADEIRSVEPTRISLLTSGGWGYRGSWTLLKGVAISLGGNGAVLITSRRGKRLQLSSRRPTDLLDATASLID